MRAWVLGSAGPIEEHPLELIRLPRPEPGPHHVRLRVNVCGICRTDIHLAEGDLPPGKDRLILGHEVVGVVDCVGQGVSRVRPGERVGVTWLGRTCGQCTFCAGGRENYCRRFEATGRDIDGGFAEFVVAHEDAVFTLEGMDLPEEEMAPLLCAGVAGYSAFRLLNLAENKTIVLYGFGPTAYYVLRVARHLEHKVLVSTRSNTNLTRARRNGAIWAGDASKEALPTQVDGAIVFPPAGGLVELALKQVRPGGVVVLAPVAMSQIDIHDYSRHLWGRDIRTLYNVNRRDSEEFLTLAREVDLSIETEVLPFSELEQAMIRVKKGRIQGANIAVRVVGR